MPSVKMFAEEEIPLEMHKVRIVQKLRLVPIEDRLKAIAGSGNNTFLLQNRDVFLDMLTDAIVERSKTRMRLKSQGNRKLAVKIAAIHGRV